MIKRTLLALGPILIYAMVLVAPQAHGQADKSLILGGDLEFPMNDCVARLKSDGAIEILGEDGQQCVDVQVTDPVDLEIVLFDQFPETSAGQGHEAGDEIYVAWAAQGQGEITCERSGDPALPGWSGSGSPWGFVALSIPVDEPAAEYALTLECQDEESGPVSKTLELPVHIPPPTVTVSLDLPILEPGGTVEVSWHAENAVSCTALDGEEFDDWPTGDSSIGTSGSIQVGIPLDIPMDSFYDVTVQCQNSAGETSSDTRSIEVVDDGLPAFCSEPERQPPPGMDPRTRIRCTGSTHTGWTCNHSDDDGSDTTWEEVWGQAFPDGQSRRIYLPTETYAALEFDSGTHGQYGSLTFVGLQASGSGAGDGRPLVSMSECPGDFSAELNNGTRCRQKLIFSEDGFRWTRGDEWNRCQLEPNTRYFINITYGSDEFPPEWDCEYPNACGNNTSSSYVE